MTFRIVRGFIDLDRNLFFSMITNRSTRGHQWKLEVRRSYCTVSAHFFSCRVVDPWNRLPADVVDAPNVAAFKIRFDRYTERETACWR